MITRLPKDKKLVPEPILNVAIVPASKEDKEKLDYALGQIEKDDRNLQIGLDTESGQILLKGMSEPHLDAAIERIKNEFKVDVHVGAPLVEYRETITRISSAYYTYERKSPKLFARVEINLQPMPPGSGYQFENKISDNDSIAKYVDDIAKGLVKATETGMLCGFPVVDFKANLTNGACEGDFLSHEPFEFAAKAAFREALAKANSVLLEPRMEVKVVTPEDCLGAIIGDLSSRRGQISAMDEQHNAKVITAIAPLGCMFGYTNTLKSISPTASFDMKFSHYDLVPLSDDPSPFRPAMAMRAIKSK